MAAVRCTLLTSQLRFLIRNQSSRLTINSPKVRDISTKCTYGKVESRKLTASQNTFGGLFFHSNDLQPFKLHSCVSGSFVPETVGVRAFSTDKSSSPQESPKDSEKSEADEKTLTVFQRFKKTYKEHGKILILVHCATSVVWFGSFYMAAVSGVDIVPWMEKMGFSETLIKPFRAGGLGFVALAYLMYKLATPARYTVTLGGTNMAIRYLRRKGKMEPIPEGHSIRNLYQDGKVELRDRQLAFQQRRRNVKVRKERIARYKK